LFQQQSPINGEVTKYPFESTTKRNRGSKVVTSDAVESNDQVSSENQDGKVSGSKVDGGAATKAAVNEDKVVTKSNAVGEGEAGETHQSDESVAADASASSQSSGSPGIPETGSLSTQQNQEKVSMSGREYRTFKNFNFASSFLFNAKFIGSLRVPHSLPLSYLWDQMISIKERKVDFFVRTRT
jgi:hypothetical protein